jgi:hypothetical protein
MARTMQTSGKPTGAPKGKAAGPKRKAGDAAPAAEQRQVRRRAVPAEKEELHPIEHGSHNQVRCGGRPTTRRRRCLGA